MSGKQKKEKKQKPINQTVWRVILFIFLSVVHVTSFFLVKAVIDLKVIPVKYIKIVAGVLIALNLLLQKKYRLP